MGEIRLEDKIAEGRFREVFLVSETECAKVLKPVLSKRYGFFSVSFPMRPYTSLKFGIDDLNIAEMQNYERMMEVLPEEVHKYFAGIKKIERQAGHNLSVCELIRDSDGKISKTMKTAGKICCNEFWEIIDHIEILLIAREIPYFGVHDRNILARTSGTLMEPVFVDHKRFGQLTFPFQPWLYTGAGIKAKLAREFRRLNKYKTNYYHCKDF